MVLRHGCAISPQHRRTVYSHSPRPSAPTYRPNESDYRCASIQSQRCAQIDREHNTSLALLFIQACAVIVFITSIRHPKNSNDFGRVLELLTTTLKSVCSQTDPEFRVIVVCNDVPTIEFSDPRIVYHKVDFLPPSEVAASNIPFAAFTRDKGSKILAGFLLALKFEPQYVFSIDADDWISRHIVEYLHSQPTHPVWYVDGGFLADRQTLRVRRKHGMNRYCGSTFIYKPSFLIETGQIKPTINEHSSQEDLVNAVSDYFFQSVLANHSNSHKFALEQGVKPKPIGLRAVCWVVGTGENHSGMTGDINGLAIDKEFCAEFGLPEHYATGQKTSWRLKMKDALGCAASKAGWFWNRVSGGYVF